MRTLITLLALMGATASARGADRPNIVYILADDLGYGDVHGLNPKGKIATPHMDRIAAEGLTFTDAHSSSAVCTPTRYSILTGRYNWRSRLKNGVLNGYSTRLIEPGRLTVASFLKQQGYATTALGKWHLGMDWMLKEGGIATKEADAWKVDYAKPIANGPTSVGFDEYFGVAASLDMPPYIFVENDRATEIPTTEKTWIRKGPASEKFEAIDVLPTLIERATATIHRRARDAKEGKPFFLYLPLTAPHTPILPTADWQGKSRMNRYADFVLQVDAAVGRVLQTLDETGLTDNTLLVFTSDNGCSPQANFPELLSHHHDPSAGFRGHKADIFEGGHRIPLLMRWPGHIKAGSRSEQTTCLSDLFATVADILDVKLPDNAAEDSVSLLPILEGKADGPVREAIVHHSINGSFAIRQGRWKLELCADSGGWSMPKPGSPQAKGLPPVQLYDLAADPAETRNLQAEHPEIVARLIALLEKYVAEGRSTPGAPQRNSREIDIHNRPTRVSP